MLFLNSCSFESALLTKYPVETSVKSTSGIRDSSGNSCLSSPSPVLTYWCFTLTLSLFYRAEVYGLMCEFWMPASQVLNKQLLWRTVDNTYLQLMCCCF